MYLYIVGFFTLGMLGVWLLVVLYTMMVKPKEGDSSGTFKKVLKRSGVLVLVYVVTMVLGTMVFSSMYEKECAPNEEDVKVMKPMVNTMVEYIIKNGMPDDLKYISGLPYQISKKPNMDDSFYYFSANENNYTIFVKSKDMLEFQSNTKKGHGYTWAWVIFNIEDNNTYVLKRPVEYFLTNTDGICSSMRM